jgi:DNA-binding transcriptional MerR regulator
MVKLHQIISLKYLGFSLEEIKSHLVSLDTPDDVASVLAAQADTFRAQLQSLSETLDAIEALKAEVLQMKQVDFKKYADIIVNLQMKNDMYWAIKHFDEATLDYLHDRFDKESGEAFLDRFNKITSEAKRLKESGVMPNSPQGQEIAKDFWALVMEFTAGDMSLLPKLIEFSEEISAPNTKNPSMQAIIDSFIQPALETYFMTSGVNPFAEGAK